MSKQPFYVGQEVVCINGLRDIAANVIKNNNYTIMEIVLSPKDNKWYVGLLEFPVINEHPIISFPCSGKYWMMYASRFAPIERTRYVVKEVEVAPEIREKAKETILEITQAN